jgi:hypothetical protein
MKRSSTIATAALGIGIALAGLNPAVAAGDPRLLGAGWVGNPNEKVHINVGLRCPGEGGVDPSDPSKLELRGRSSSFRLDRVLAAFCQNNLFEGSGVGSCNGVGGFDVRWRFTDGGLGGPDTREDRVEIEVRGPSADCQLSVVGPLVGGNLQVQARAR